MARRKRRSFIRGLQGPQRPLEAYRGLRGLMSASTQPLRPNWRPLKCSAISAAPFPPHDLTLWFWLFKRVNVDRQPHSHHFCKTIMFTMEFLVSSILLFFTYQMKIKTEAKKPQKALKSSTKKVVLLSRIFSIGCVKKHKPYLIYFFLKIIFLKFLFYNLCLGPLLRKDHKLIFLDKISM